MWTSGVALTYPSISWRQETRSKGTISGRKSQNFVFSQVSLRELEACENVPHRIKGATVSFLCFRHWLTSKMYVSVISAPQSPLEVQGSEGLGLRGVVPQEQREKSWTLSESRFDLELGSCVGPPAMGPAPACSSSHFWETRLGQIRSPSLSPIGTESRWLLYEEICTCTQVEESE